MFWDAPNSRQIPKEMLANNTLAEGNPTSMTLNCGTPPASAPRPMHLAPVGVDEGSRGEQSE
ncbi:uncharacterized protein BDCG_17212, partial [Blastomyces dermatitidis ER-3]